MAGEPRQVEVRILGPLEVLADGTLLPLAAHKERALLAVLATRPREVVSTDELIESLWGGRPPETAATSLQVYVSRLRKLLEPERGKREAARVLVSRAPGYALALQPAQVDARRFESLAEEGRSALAAGDPSHAASQLRAALALWRGAALAEFVYEAWAQAEAARLEELRLVALEDRIAADLDSGRHGELTPELELLIAAQPLRETLRGQLMLALYRGGRQTDALDAYQRARDTLVGELGLEPSRDLQNLNRAILNHDEALTAPMRDVSAKPHRDSGYVPAALTPLVGRSAELQELAALLQGTETRLITVSGTGGVGKSRLALEAGRQNAGVFADGVYVIELAAAGRAVSVLSAIASAVGVVDSGGGDDALMQALKRALFPQHLLLLLDNFEQVLSAAPIVTELLGAAPRIRVLATSRAPLRLTGEREIRLAPLPLPFEDEAGTGALLANEAVRLFIARARSDEPDAQDQLPAIAAICRRVDGLPLAIELAAARTRLFTPAELLPELERRFQVLVGGARDQPERQQTLRDTVRWSYELLSPRQKRLFARLSVFVGGFTIDAAQSVSDAELDDIEALAEHSLISRVATQQRRFSMLETLREYAAERLRESGEEHSMRRRFAQELVNRFGDPTGSVRAPVAVDAWTRVPTEIDNIRAAVDWAATTGDPALGVDLATSLARYWDMNGMLTEAVALYEALLVRRQELDERRVGQLLDALAYTHMVRGEFSQAMDLFRSAADTFDVVGDQNAAGRVFAAISYTASWQGDLESAYTYAERALSMAQTLNDRLLEADAERSLAAVREELGDFEIATKHWKRSAGLFELVGDDLSAMIAEGNIGWGLLLQGAYEDAEPVIRRAVSSLQPTWIGLSQTFRQNLAASLLLQGRAAEARTELEYTLTASLRSFRERLVAESLFSAAATAASDGNIETATRLFGAAEALLKHMGLERSPVETALVDRYLLDVVEDEAEAVATPPLLEGRGLTPEQALEVALAAVRADLRLQPR